MWSMNKSSYVNHVPYYFFLCGSIEVFIEKMFFGSLADLFCEERRKKIDEMCWSLCCYCFDPVYFRKKTRQTHMLKRRERNKKARKGNFYLILTPSLLVTSDTTCVPLWHLPNLPESVCNKAVLSSTLLVRGSQQCCKRNSFYRLSHNPIKEKANGERQEKEEIK